MKFRRLSDGRVKLTQVAVQTGIAAAPIKMCTIVLRDLTPLERLDVEVTQDMTPIEMSIRLAGWAIESWDGEPINVLQLMDRKFHDAIAAINTFIERQLMQIPKPVVTGDRYSAFTLTFPSGSVVKLQELTVLEMATLEADQGEGLRSVRRCRVIANAIESWNGETLSADDLLSDRSKHSEVVAVDSFCSEEFTPENAIEELSATDDLLDEREESIEPQPMVELKGE